MFRVSTVTELRVSFAPLKHPVIFHGGIKNVQSEKGIACVKYHRRAQWSATFQPSDRGHCVYRGTSLVASTAQLYSNFLCVNDSTHGCNPRKRVWAIMKHETMIFRVASPSMGPRDKRPYVAQSLAARPINILYCYL